jgi:hypothetical protein
VPYISKGIIYVNRLNLPVSNSGYRMSVGLILNLLNQMNKIILSEPNIVLFKEFNKLSIESTRIFYLSHI